MLEQKDIELARKKFKDWDYQQKWDKPTGVFIQHTKKKAFDSFDLASYLLQKIQQTDELKHNNSVTLWIITQCYYSMFFEVEYLLATEGKKIPDDNEDNTHKTIYLAFLYYYIIKGSELEQKTLKTPTTSRMSKALMLLRELQEETFQLQRVHNSAEHLKQLKEKRNNLTYQITRNAEIKEAQDSFKKAAEFRELIKEYIENKKIDK